MFSPAGDSSGGAYRDTASTAPTTPDDHSSFSPVSRAGEQDDLSEHILLGQSSSSSSQFANRSNNGTLLGAPRSVRNICCVGAGYVGPLFATVIAYQNPHIYVAVVDQDAQRIRQWNSRHLPIYEPGLRDTVRIARDGSRAFSLVDEADDSRLGGGDTWEISTSERRCGPTIYQQPKHTSKTIQVPARQPNLVFSVNADRCIAEADLVFIAVNTPTKSSGVGAGAAMDMTAFEAAVCEVAQYARAGTIIVEKSTVPCKTAQLVQEILAVHRPGVHFDILSNPEFLAAGTAMQDLLHPDRVLIGSFPTTSGRRAAGALADIYAAWVPRERIIGTNVWSAELAKVVANAMLAQRLSSINSISAICKATGADIDEVAVAVGSDTRIGAEFLRPGIGFGGSCLKKDVLSLVYLAESLGLGHVAEYWRQVVTVNEQQRDGFSRCVVRCLNNTLVGKKITVLGFAFKANTSDVRESPTMEIIRRLREENPLEIAVFDPCCNPVTVRREIEVMMKLDQDAGRHNGCPVVAYSDVYEACAASNAVLIMTECDEFRNVKREPSGRSNPRPFARRRPTEMDILALHEFLLPSSAYGDGDPLQRYIAEPSCTKDCPDCELIEMQTGGCRAQASVDWRKVSYHMKKPRWLFDGKGIINREEMALLDIHVESIGRQGKL